MTQRTLVEDVYPLAPVQEGMLFHCLDDEGAGLYVGQFGFRMSVALDEDAFEGAWQAVVDRHPALRTGFAWEKVDAPLQVVRREARLRMRREDWRGRTAEDRRSALEAYLREDRARGFDLSRAPLMRLALFRTGEAEYQLVWTHHHTVLDGWSLGLVYRDVLAAYDALAAGERPRLGPAAPYRALVAWLREQDPAAAGAYWRETLAGFAAPTPLGIGRAGTARDRDPAQVERALPRETAAAVDALARSAGTTQSTVVQAAWALLLSRYGGEDDVVFGVVVSGRTPALAGAAETVGLFVNTLPVRVRVRPAEAVAGWIAGLQRGQAALRAHEHTPLARVQGWSEVPRGVPLFDSVLSFQNFRVEAGRARDRFGVEEVWGIEAAENPLFLAASPVDGTLALRLGYHRGRIGDAEAARVLEHLGTVLRAFAAAPGAALRDVPLLTEGERRRLEEWQGPRAEYPRGAAVHEVIRERAAAWPDAVAAVRGERALRYRELEARAGRLAAGLRARGVGPEVRVALFLERGLELAVSLLGVLRAGGAYVPVDPEYPSERIAYLLADSGAALLLTTRALAARLPGGGPPVLCVDEPAEGDGAVPAAAGVLPDNLAYAIYTSGSTGRPKAALVGHRSLLCYAEAMRGALGLTPEDRVLQFASPSFDVMVEEVFPAWLSGAAVVFPEGDLLGAPAELLEVVERHGVTGFELPTAYWHEWVRALAEEGRRLPECVRFVIVGGERVLPERLREWAGMGVPLVHVFGLTETSVTSSVLRLEAGEDGSRHANLPVGRPLPNVEMHVLDDRREPAPVGVPGELYVGGDGVARGYLGRPELTAERFVPHPRAPEPGARLYRTGDRARWLEDGTLEFLGRMDQQVKVRGFRIEPAEIEAALAEHEAVEEAAVVARGDGPGEARLVAYVAASRRLAPQELREHLRRRLPEHMVPGAFVAVDALPLTRNGKLDRRRLPDPGEAGAGEERAHEAPRTPVEATLARIWSEVLRVERVGIHDDYFELGGDSILSIQIVSRAHRAGLRLRPRQLFESPTIARLAPALADGAAAPAAGAEEAAGEAPLTPIQRWFFEQPVPGRHHWNMSVLLEPRRPLDPAHLEAALRAVVACHGALRFRYSRPADGAWRQAYAPAAEAAVERVDLAGTAAEALAEAVERHCARVQAGLNLERGPLLRAVLLEPGGGRPQRLLLAAHHLVVDGVSWRILVEDLQAALERAERGVAPALAPEAASFGRWAARLEEFVRGGGFEGELDYWLDEPRRLARPLPADHSGADRPGTVAGARSVEVALSAEETRELLQDVPRAYRTRMDEALLAALVGAFAGWTGEVRLLVEVEGHGREELFDDLDLSRTVGWFTTVYPVLLDARGAEGPGGVLRAVKEQVRAVPGRGIGWGALRWLSPRPEVRERLAALPRAEVRFEYLGQLDGSVSGEGPFRLAAEGAGPSTGPDTPRSHLLEVSCAVLDGRLRLTWTYGEGVHRRDTVRALAERHLAELASLAAHCRSGAGGCTPSDFPLAGLDQAGLDALVGDGREVEDLYPPSPTQEGMLFEVLAAPGSGMYVAQLAFDLAGDLDEDALERAWRAVLERHPALRAGFAGMGSERLLQVVRRAAALSFRREDRRALAPAEQEAELEAFLAADRARGFDPARAPLMRMALLRTGERAWVLAWSFLQLVLDGWSLPVVFREVLALYDAFARGRSPELPAPAPYREYVAWLGRQDLAAAERFWRGALAGFAAATPLGVDRPARAGIAGGTGRARARLPAGTTARLQALARARGLTPNTLAQGAWALLLSRYSGEDDVVFGTTVSGRPAELPGIEQMVGLFINTLPVRARVPADAPLAPWLAGLQAHQAEQREHEHTPLVTIQGWSEVPRGTPLFESLFVFENYPPLESGGAGERGWTAAQRKGVEQASYPLSLAVLPDEELVVHAEFDAARLDAASVERLLGHLAALLGAMPADPERPLSALPLLDPAERGRLLAEWSEPERAAPWGDLLVHRLFEARAVRAPGAPAVVYGGDRLSYAELERRSGRLARRLRRLGVGPEVRVGICMERGTGLVEAVLGVLRAGGAYVPLDPEHPAERLAYILDDAAAAVLVAPEHLAARIPAGAALVVRPDGAGEGPDPEGADPLPAPAGPGNLAYVVYTSGTTGRPKGVQVEHRALANALLGWEEAYGAPGGGRRWLQVAGFAFDVFTADLVRALCSGGTLIVCPPEARADPARLHALMVREGVDAADLVPAALRELSRHLGETGGSLDFMRVLVGGSDAWHAREYEAVRRLAGPDTRVVNSYGVTEAAVDSTFFEGDAAALPADAPVPIGRPFANTRACVLDAGLEPVPAGVAGELFVGGPNLARGYQGRPDLTAEKFLPDPFALRPGERLYRTGDRARRRADGVLEFLGRADDQVKVRGFRIEPGEVEAALREHPEVEQAAVVAREDAPGQRRLVAYVVPAAGAAARADGVRSFLRGRLPEHMVPAAVVSLDRLPLTPNGKVDRRALPAPGGDATRAAPLTPVEEILAGIWSDVLRAERVGARDSFFELGGHSLLATRVVSRVRQALGAELPLRAVFEAPTLEGLAARVEALLRGGGGVDAPPIVPVPRDRPLALSFAQRRLWLVDQLDPGSPAYNLAEALRLRGRLDEAALEWTLGEVARRHETLRTVFARVDGEPVQVVLPPAPVALPRVDLRGLPEAERERTAQRLARDEALRPFDLERGPPLRATLLRAGEEESVVLFTLHHVASDEWSTAVLVREVSALYGARTRGEPSPLPELPVQYADFAAWQRERLRGEVLEAHLAWWRGQLAGAPPLLELPADRPRLAVAGPRGAGLALDIPPATALRLRELGRREGATLFMTLLAAWQALLARACGQDDVCVGTPVAGRGRLETEGMIGFFVNTLVLRADLADDPSFRAHLHRVRETTLGAYAHQDLPFEKLLDELRVERSLAHTPLFQAMLVVQDAAREELELGGVRAEPLAAETATARFDLTLEARDHGDALSAWLEYRAELFDEATARRMAGWLGRLLEGAAADPERRLGDLPLLGEDERVQVVDGWNSTRVEFAETGLVHQLFGAWAARDPGRTAVVFEGESLSYGELDRRAARLARRLRARGVGPEVRVGICAERSPEAVVALLAILRAGGAYVPLDPEYPAERLAYMLEDSAVALVLTHAAVAGRLPPGGAPVLLLDGAGGDAGPEGGEGAEAAGPALAPESLCYVIYTSGSTGRPKGAMNTHAGMRNRLLWMQAEYGLDASDVVLQKTPMSFDVSVWEFFWPLMAGARLVLARPGGHRDGDYLAGLVAREGVTTLHFVPSMLQAFLETPGLERCAPLRRVFCSGEALAPGLMQAALERFPGAELHDLYGPTEAAVDVTYWACVPGSPVVPIGRPVANTRTYVLDRRYHPVPPGVAGELFIGGVQVGRGYLARPELTAERFVPDPFSGAGGERLYRTGDRARWSREGLLEYLGRADFQVKVRGFRVEPGEIESVLAAHPGVREAVVVVREDVPGHGRLVAYVVPADGDAPPAGELRAHLAARLPEHMVPAAFVALETLPLTPSGKLDRRALPAPEREVRAHRPPRTAAEAALAGAWTEVLGAERVGIDDNFFELGGDSILAIQAVARARRAGWRVTPRQVFQHPTVAALARAAVPEAGEAAAPAPAGGPAPLTPIQAWFLAARPAEAHHFNQSVLLELRGGPDPAALRAATAALLGHHDALRARFLRTEDGWTQHAAPPCGPLPFVEVDLGALPAAARGAALDAAGGALQASLDLARGPLLRAALFRGGDGWARLLLIVHHLVVDGVSWRVMLEDLRAAFDAAAAGRPVVLPPPTTPFAAWARLLAERAASGALDGEAAYWKALARRAPAPLPLDGPGGPDPVAGADTVSVALDAAETRALLQEVPAAYRTRIDDVLLCALARAFARWTGERRLLVDVEGHGREEELAPGVDLSRTVGWFTTLYPVLLDLEGIDGEGEALRAVKEQLRAVPGRGIGFGALRWGGSGETRRALTALPRPEVAFNYLGRFDAALAADARFAFASGGRGAEQSPRAERTHRIEVTAIVQEGRLEVAWTYGRALLRREAAARLADGYLAELRGLVAHCRAAGAGGATPSDFPLARLTQERLDAVAIAGRGVEDVYPLTSMQEGMLFHARLESAGGVYLNRFGFELRGPLDEDAFLRAWQGVVDRHPALRTRFVWEGIDAPLQVVERRADVPLHREDWRGLSAPEQEARMEAFLESDRARGIDVSRAPLMRLALFRVGGEAWRTVWTHHHLVLDGWSLSLVYGDVLALYGAARTGEAPALDPPVPFRDYAAWLARRPADGAEAHWREALAGFTAATPLGIDRRARSGAPAAGHGVAGARLSPSAAARLRAFARAHGLTPNTVVQGAWALLLARYSGGEDVVFGATVSGRPPELPDAERMVGLFINTLPVRVRAAPAATLAPWLGELQAQQAAQRQHEHTPLAEIQRWSGVPAGEPLFETLLVYENFPVREVLSAAGSHGLEVRDLPDPGAPTNYPLSLTVGPGEGLHLQATYARDRLDGPAVERMLGHLGTLLEEMAAGPRRRLAELPLMGEAERREVLAASGGAPAPRLEEGCVHRLFEAQAARTPAAVALAAGEERVTYAELDARANRLARHLRRLGVGPEVRVGLCVERGAGMVAAMLGVLKAGGAYVALDPAYPAERLAYMLEDSGARVLAGPARLLESLPASPAVRLALDAGAERIAAESPEPPGIAVEPGHLAYVVYTSGSTGRPKGVLAAHRGAASYLGFLAAEYGVGPDDAVLQLASLSFDASVRDILGPLTRGARLVLVRPDEAAEPARLLARMREERVTAVMAIVPSRLRPLLDAAAAGPGDPAPPLRLLLSSGEPLPAEECRRARRVFGPRLRVVNQWGPTECAMTSTFHTVDDGEEAAVAPVGVPIPGTRVYVLDAELRPVPPGVLGEAYVAGPGLARGYQGRPELSAESFLPDPHAAEPGARMYRVGDRVRRRPDGVLEFIGRADHQVKVQGARVEPAEVEAALSRHPAVRAAAVVARPAAPGEHRLAAYVVAGEGGSAAALRAFLGGTLPPYMVPADFVHLDALPLLPNGKLDRRALPEPAAPAEARVGRRAGPRTPAEELLAGIWGDVLGVERVGADDDFFALGGHSLLAMRVAARVEEAFGVELPLRALFEDATVPRLAARIEALRGAADGGAHPLVPVERGGALPLSFAQRRLWFLHQVDPGSGAWNMPFPLRIRGALDARALALALSGLARRHEVLRTRFDLRGGEPVQLPRPPAPLPLPVVELAALPPAARERAAERLALEDAARPFDLERAPLLRATLVRLAADDAVLLVTLHHVAADGWSLEVLARETSALYCAALRGEEAPLPPLPVQYADYAVWQRARLAGDVLDRQLGYWRERLAGAPTALALPADFPRPDAPGERAGLRTRDLSGGALEALEALARRESATPYMALMGVFAVLLFRYTGEDDLLVGAPAANRTRPEVQGLIGFFVNLLPLRVRLAGNPTFRALLRQVRETALGAYAHAELPFEELVHELGVERVPGRRPLLQAALEVEPRGEAELALPGASVDALGLHTRRAKFELELRVGDDGRGGRSARMLYDAGLFRSGTVDRMLDDFAAVLEQVAEHPDGRVLDVALEGDREPAAAAAGMDEADFAF